MLIASFNSLFKLFVFLSLGLGFLFIYLYIFFGFQNTKSKANPEAHKNSSQQIKTLIFPQMLCCKADKNLLNSNKKKINSLFKWQLKGLFSSPVL